MAQKRRKAVEELTLRKIMTVSTMTAALYANTNLDANENKELRGRMIDELNTNLEEKFAETVAKIYGAKDPNSIEKVDMDDPFLTAINVPSSVREEIFGEQEK